MKEIGRSSIFLGSISNRLAASSTRARFLGLIVGTAISQLIEQPGKAMKFDLEEMKDEEAKWYMDLVKTQDALGSLDSIRLQKDSIQNSAKSSSSKPAAPKQPRVNQNPVKIVSIEEIEESGNEDEEDEDLVPYEKPDEDPSDDDDDPTLVQRNKPTAPV